MKTTIPNTDHPFIMETLRHLSERPEEFFPEISEYFSAVHFDQMDKFSAKVVTICNL